MHRLINKSIIAGLCVYIGPCVLTIFLHIFNYILYMEYFLERGCGFSCCCCCNCI